MNGKSTLTLPSDREIVMSRIFDAPRELIFKAVTDPKLIPQWWGLRSTTTVVEKMDVRPGGAWRFVQRNENGNEFGFSGEFREIVPPERVVQTFGWDGMPGHVIVESFVLEDLGGGKTRMTNTSHFTSKEDRDGMLASGMESGANESWDQLAEFLQKQQA
jgi:uncharacterized protein YndB with AHSA1/START domain